MRRAQVSRRRRRRVPGGRSRTPSRGPLITRTTQPHSRCLPCRLGDFLPRSPTYSMHNFNELHRAGAQFTQSGGLSGLRMRYIPDPAHDQTAVDSHRRPGYTGGAVTSQASPMGRGKSTRACVAWAVPRLPQPVGHVSRRTRRRPGPHAEEPERRTPIPQSPSTLRSGSVAPEVTGAYKEPRSARTERP